MKKIIKKINNQYLICYIAVLLFLLNPLLGLLILMLYCFQLGQRCHYGVLSCIAFLAAVFVGLINATKLHENDLVWYVAGYLEAGSQSFFTYLLSFGINGVGQELAFPVFNYIVYQIVGPNPRVYVFTHSLLTYCLLNFSLLRFGKALNYRKSIVLLGIVVMTFTPYIFAMSAILLRQFLASALLMYILVNRFFYGKKSYWLVLVMVLTHTSSVFFVPFIFHPFLKQPISAKTFILYFLIVITILNIQLIAAVLFPLVQNIPVLQYVVFRASIGTNFDLGSLSFIKVIVSIATILGPFLVIYFINKKYIRNLGLVHFFNIGFFLVLFIIGNLHQSELSVRLNFYVWQFFPFSFLIVANHLKHMQMVALPISIGLIGFFIIYLDFSMWTYSVNDEILYYTFWQYFVL